MEPIAVRQDPGGIVGRRGKGGAIWVSRTIPFAPALLIGTLLTVILSGYIFKINQ